MTRQKKPLKKPPDKDPGGVLIELVETLLIIAKDDDAPTSDRVAASTAAQTALDRLQNYPEWWKDQMEHYKDDDRIYG